MQPRYARYGSGRVFTRSQVAAAIMLALLPIAALMQGFWVARHKAPAKPFLPRFQTERVDCPYCGGAGTIRDPDNPVTPLACPICFGVGGNYMRKLDHRTELLCPACVGMGRLYDVDTGYARGCMRCGGRGLIEVLPPLDYLSRVARRDAEPEAAAPPPPILSQPDIP